MSYMERHRGGAPVGMMEELPKLEAAIVRYLRLWLDGPESQALVWNDFYRFYGKAAKGHMAAFEAMILTVMNHERRPLQRHHIDCSCVGGDESAFANFVISAAVGEREDAMLLASNFMRADMAVIAATMAERVGLSLSRMVMPMPKNFTHNTPNTQH